MRRSAARSDSKKHAAPLLGAFLLAAALVAFNNLRLGLGGVRYVGVHLLAGGILALISIAFLGSDSLELGLRGNRPRVVVAAGSAAVVLVAPLFLFAALSPRHDGSRMTGSPASTHPIWHFMRSYGYLWEPPCSRSSYSGARYSDSCRGAGSYSARLPPACPLGYGT
jgi:hypothetical protein